MEPGDIDIHSRTWRAVERLTATKIEEGRDKLEREADPALNAYTRGYVAAMREIHALKEPPVPDENGPSRYHD